MIGNSRIMGVVLERVASQQNLLDAWEAVRDSAYADGDAGSEVERFEAMAARRISEIAEALLAGMWKPSPAHHVKIAKPSGGVRHLAIPPVEDRVVERAVLTEVDALVDPHLMPWSFGYRRGIGVDDAIRAMVEARDAGNAWVLRADIADCFDEIPRWPVLQQLTEVCRDDDLVTLIRSLVHRRVIGRDKGHKMRSRGLAQGSPLSPMLANLYLDRFDRAMAERGWQVIRFADDFAIPARSRVEAEEAVTAADECAAAIDLRLNTGKTTVASFDNGVDFLGQTITATSGAGALDSSHPLETTMYVDHTGAMMRTRGERLLVTDGDETLAKVNWRRIRQVVIIGRVNMSTPYLHRALKRGVETVLLDDSGGYLGRVQPGERGREFDRRIQYRAADSKNASLRLARGFVLGKLQNQRVLLQRLDRKMAEPILGRSIRNIDKFRYDAAIITSLVQLRGLEGAGAREYFKAIGDFLPPEWGWHGRVRRPPTDPINAMLSFGYTLLSNEGVTAAELAGLDPDIGFLHLPHPGRPSLALDLVEEFRALIVDATVFALLGRKQVSPADFETVDDGACRMSKTARDAFLSTYEKRMLQLVTHRETGRRISYRTALHMQARSIGRAMDGGDEYQPIMWK